jgi:hypothetical protein
LFVCWHRTSDIHPSILNGAKLGERKGKRKKEKGKRKKEKGKRKKEKGKRKKEKEKRKREKREIVFLGQPPTTKQAGGIYRSAKVTTAPHLQELYLPTYLGSSLGKVPM